MPYSPETQDLKLATPALIEIEGADNVSIITVTVGVATTRLDTGLPNRRSIEIHNRASNPNNSNVVVNITSPVAGQQGRRLEIGEAWGLDVDENVQFFAVGSGAGMLVDVTEIAN